MNIKNSNKFIPNLLFLHSQPFDQQYFSQKSHSTPFRPLDNTEPQITRNQRKKNRRPKYLIKTQTNQSQQNKLDNIFVPRNRLIDGETKEVNPAPNIFNCNNPNKTDFIINFQDDESSQIIQERKKKKIQFSQQLQVQQKVQFQNTERLNLIDWSSNNDDDSFNIIQSSTHQLFEKKCQKLQSLVQKTNTKYRQDMMEEQQKKKPQQSNIKQIVLQQQIQKIHNKKQEQDNFKKQITNNEIIISPQNIFKQIAQGMTIQCLIKRDKNTNDGIHQYNVYLQKSMKHILLIRKQGMWEYCFYLRYQTKNNGQYSTIKIATFQSNFLNYSFTLLKCNENYSQMTVCYDTNILGMKGPRKMKVYLPKQIIPFQYLQDCYDEKKWKGKIQKLVNKTAKWNEKVKSYVLNFNGRALKSSIKNFVITDQHESEDKSFVIFGKAGANSFNLDIQKPFSIIQGVALAISSFQRKILCD